MPGVVEVSVVVPAYGAADVIVRQLDALAPQVVAAAGEIVVVDDASPDATAAVVAAWAAAHPDVRCTVVQARTRGYVNASRNAGIHLSAGALVAVTDADDVVRPGWLDALRAAAAPGVVVSGVFVWPGEDVVHLPPTFYGVPGPTILGSTMLLSRRDFDAIGGFDESFRAGGSETEFALRARFGAGMDIAVVPDAVIEYHVVQGWATQRRRFARQQAGFAIVARRLREIPGAPRSTFTVRRRLRGALGYAGRVVLGGGPGRRTSLDRLWVELVAVVRIAQCWWRRPPARLLDPARIDAGYRIVHPVPAA